MNRWPTAFMVAAALPLYRQKKKAYDAALAEFDRDRAQPFSARDLAAVQARPGIKG